MTAKEIAQEILKTFSDKSRRTIGAQARTVQGISCEPTSKNAVSYCLVGAAIKATSNEKEREAFYRACASFLSVPYLRQGSPAGNVGAFNDKATFAQVVELLTKVAREAR